MRLFFSFLLIVSVLLQACSYLITYSAFEANQNFIVEKLCINKDKPMMNCGGKCYLTKEFKEQDKQQQSPFSNSRDKQESVQFCEELIPISFCAIPLKGQLTNYKSDNNPYSYNPLFFHPPAV